MPLCKYGCGQEGKFSSIPYRQTKPVYRCSEHRNHCPELVRKNKLGNQKTPDERAEITQKYYDTCEEKYGVQAFSQSREFKEAYAATCLERYGSDHLWKTDEWKKLRRMRMKELYGVEFAAQDPEWYKRICDKLEKEHGVRNPGSLNPPVSKECIAWLDYLGVPEEWRETPIPNTPYTADALDSDNQIIYEYNGDFYHGGPTYKDRVDEINPQTGKTFGQLYAYTKGRERLLEGLGYKIISIWGSEWYKLR